jgi:Myb-like DNA-binding domain.
MTEGQIWQVMLRLKIFTPWMVLNELKAPSYLRNIYKEKIRSIIVGQLKNRILIEYNQEPPVFGLPNQDIESIKRTCGICGNRFIPVGAEDTYCSEQCEKEYRKQYLHKRRRQKGMTVRKRYTKEEEKIIYDILSVYGCKSAVLQELSKRLGRHPEAIKSKYKQMMKKEAKHE